MLLLVIGLSPIPVGLGTASAALLQDADGLTQIYICTPEGFRLITLRDGVEVPPADGEDEDHGSFCRICTGLLFVDLNGARGLLAQGIDWPTARVAFLEATEVARPAPRFTRLPSRAPPAV